MTHAARLAAFAALTFLTLPAHAQEREVVFAGNPREGITLCAPGYECSYVDGQFSVCKNRVVLGTQRANRGYIQVWAGCSNGWVWLLDEHGKRVKQ
jgi:hypothetical protein